VRFRAQIDQDGERLDIGSFDSEHRAARAYDGASRLFHGKFGKTNQELGLYDKHPDRRSCDLHII